MGILLLSHLAQVCCESGTLLFSLTETNNNIEKYIMQWILIMIMSAAYDGGKAIDTATFNTKVKCEFALEAVLSIEMSDMNTINGVCVPAGKKQN